MSKQASIEQAVEVARQILADEIHMVTGCRQLREPLTDLQLWTTPEFSVFMVVDSEADSFPIDECQRTKWNAGALQKKDEEYKVAVAGYEPDVKDACKNLIAKIG